MKLLQQVKLVPTFKRVQQPLSYYSKQGSELHENSLSLNDKSKILNEMISEEEVH